MSRAAAMSCEWARATDAAHGWMARAGSPAAARSALSLTRSAASKASTDTDEAVVPRETPGTGEVSAAAGLAPARAAAAASVAARDTIPVRLRGAIRLLLVGGLVPSPGVLS